MPRVHYPLVQMAAPHCLFEKKALAVSSARLRQHPPQIGNRWLLFRSLVESKERKVLGSEGEEIEKA
ncbi:unnamed protein product [Prunus armeniaca]|uniref:Uncharacterized protein n=1 Tax=Prunus armeniaca TaxID=36596 RepID=A0A6J5WVJ9_PRUAR|nr:unnamed protein product [Prunus armeniaca]CAB4303154.1 unnamed protein product [Prunus armeniaca]